MLRTNDYKWIAYKNEAIFIHTWNKKFKVVEKKSIDILLDIFPSVKYGTVLYKDESMIELKFVEVWRKLNQKINNLCIEEPSEDKACLENLSKEEFLSSKAVNEIKFNNMDDKHKALQNLTKSIDKFPYDIEFLGMSNLIQVPYKIANMKYVVNGVTVNYYDSSSDIYETYIKTITMGLSNLFNKLEQNENNRWIIVNSEEEISTNGYIPLLINYVKKLYPSLIYRYEFDIKEYQHIVVELIKNYQDKINIEELDFKLFNIKDTTLFNLVISFKDSNDIIYCDYGENLTRLINRGLEKLYTTKVQNDIVIYEDNLNITFQDVEDIKQEIVCGGTSENSIAYLLEKLNLDFIIEEWKYNYLLQNTGQTCLKISLVNKEEI